MILILCELKNFGAENRFFELLRGLYCRWEFKEKNRDQESEFSPDENYRDGRFIFTHIIGKVLTVRMRIFLF